MTNRLIISGILFWYGLAFAATNKLEGTVFDKLTGKRIGNAVVRLTNSLNSSSSNSEGCFSIRLVSGKNILIISEIGYQPDTLIVDYQDIPSGINIFLLPSSSPNNNIASINRIYSANDIIKLGIASKELEKDSLTNYEFHAFNRCFIKENNNIGLASGNYRFDFDEVTESFKLITNLWDSTEMRINSINEYVSNGFYEKPSYFREVIEAQKSRSVMPNTLAALLGNRRIQNLYWNELRFYDRPIPGPFSNDALEYYSYSLSDTLMMDNYRVFKIHFVPKDMNDPGLFGFIYISESLFKPLKIEAELNSAAITGGSFQKVSVSQQFQPYLNNIYLPVDYRISASSSYIGMVKMEYDFRSVISDYKINSSVSDNISDKALFTVLPGAEKKDSSYWKNQQSVYY
jgi:hypothetical protein